MGNYYQTNAIYRYLDENPHPFFKFPKGNIGALIYGDKNTFHPKVLSLAAGVKADEPLSNSYYET